MRVRVRVRVKVGEGLGLWLGEGEACGVGAARRRDEWPPVQVQEVLQRCVDFEHHAASNSGH